MYLSRKSLISCAFPPVFCFLVSQASSENSSVIASIHCGRKISGCGSSRYCLCPVLHVPSCADGHLVQKYGGQFLNGPVKVLGAEIDLPICLVTGVPYLVDTAPAIGSAPSVRQYGDGWAGKLSEIKMLVEAVKHSLVFLRSQKFVA